MDNILKFPVNKSTDKLGKEAETHLLDVIKETVMPDTLKQALLDLPNSIHMEKYDVYKWTMIGFHLHSEPDVNNTYIAVESYFREYINPEFGISDPIEFIKIGYGYSDNPPELSDLPGDLIDMHQKHAESFVFDPKMDVSNILIYRAILSYCLDHPATLFISHIVEHNQFRVQLAERVRELDLWLHYSLVFSFAPILLDHCAFLMRKSKEDNKR